MHQDHLLVEKFSVDEPLAKVFFLGDFLKI
jgi:hypothetical protein